MGNCGDKQVNFAVVKAESPMLQQQQQLGITKPVDAITKERGRMGFRKPQRNNRGRKLTAETAPFSDSESSHSFYSCCVDHDDDVSKEFSVSDIPPTETSSSIHQNNKATTASGTTPKKAMSDPAMSAFEFVSSVVKDGKTGDILSAAKVIRGSTRCEVLSFYVHAKLHHLTRHVVTSKKIGFGHCFVNVSTESIDMGNFEPPPLHHNGRDDDGDGDEQRPLVVKYNLVPQQVPNTRMAKGQYRIHITYTAQNLKDQILRDETVEFTIV